MLAKIVKEAIDLAQDEIRDGLLTIKRPVLELGTAKLVREVILPELNNEHHWGLHH